jgi:glyoxylase-like metal-dependent hydrolase (beta-lactamase superfamily II)
MGDGSMTLLPTPGHTPGSMSMLVRSRGLPPILLVGDLTYELDLLMNDQVPGIGDAAALRSSFAKVRAMKDQLPDMVLLPAHDPKATDALRQAVKLIDSD